MDDYRNGILEELQKRLRDLGPGLLNGTLDDVMGLLPHRGPALLIENYDFLVPGKAAMATMLLRADASYFQGHFPDCPILPAHTLTEMFALVCGLASAAGYRERKESVPKGLFAGADVRFKESAVPGDVLTLIAEIVKARSNLVVGRCFAGITRPSGDKVVLVEEAKILIGLKS